MSIIYFYFSFNFYIYFNYTFGTLNLQMYKKKPICAAHPTSASAELIQVAPPLS